MKVSCQRTAYHIIQVAGTGISKPAWTYGRSFIIAYLPSIAGSRYRLSNSAERKIICINLYLRWRNHFIRIGRHRQFIYNSSASEWLFWPQFFFNFTAGVKSGLLLFFLLSIIDFSFLFRWFARLAALFLRPWRSAVEKHQLLQPARKQRNKHVLRWR